MLFFIIELGIEKNARSLETDVNEPQKVRMNH